ncbi:alpha-L-rhamnosidase C-terminal domain-containing protein, partial [Streptomyces sp. NPDC020996]|uniref:alpha-L-rhamnosidase C-terminal domain-containing protein n=1 Tax=Streptomyces sp. NPDC020996 TaxID=3154791 RepID=UPI00340F5F09
MTSPLAPRTRTPTVLTAVAVTPAFASGSYRTPYGVARTDRERSADGFRLTVDVPAGSTAEVHPAARRYRPRARGGAPAACRGHRGGVPGRLTEPWRRTSPRRPGGGSPATT